MDEIKTAYMNWLLSLIGGRSYFHLCKELHKTIFRWHVSNDDNRIDDARGLKERFVWTIYQAPANRVIMQWIEGPCSVFEVLVALSERMADQLDELTGSGGHPEKCFVEFLVNLRLGGFTDGQSPNGFSAIQELRIGDICQRLVERTYDADGRGGLFPLKKWPRKDRRDVELWYQMMDYLAEKHG